MLAARQGPAIALGAPADCTRDMTGGRECAAAGQYELLEWRQTLIELLELRLEPGDALGAEDRAARNRQLATQIKQVVLPIASMRAASLGTRVPSPNPVLPSSPVRVMIFESRLPMRILYNVTRKPA